MLKKALTKGTIYPIVKSVSKWFGVKLKDSLRETALSQPTLRLKEDDFDISGLAKDTE